jgi:hypothetical protein
MQAVREYGRGHQPSPATAKPPSPSELEGEPTYLTRITQLLQQQNFGQLEKEAAQARASKERAVGGVWKLYLFYEALSKPPAGDQSSESDWKPHIASLKKWVAAQPQSAAARITLAETYMNYGWFARGSGYADTVSDSGWELLARRTQLAKSVLLEASRLKEKCPYWYEVVQDIVLAEGWDKLDAREVFDQAAAFEPTYYHFYRAYANYILPKWHGDEGETQLFAEEVAAKLPEPDSSIVYFEIASLLACQCDKERDSLDGMSWSKVKQGYTELERFYGTSNLKNNRFAYMAFVAEDRLAAQQAFALVGSTPNHTVWRTQENFDSAKAWATAP